MSTGEGYHHKLWCDRRVAVPVGLKMVKFAVKRQRSLSSWALSRPVAVVVTTITVAAWAAFLHSTSPFPSVQQQLEETRRQPFPTTPEINPEIMHGNASNPRVRNAHLDSRPEQPSPIPHTLMFTYSHNILDTKEPPVFYRNVQRTIDLYRKAWNEPNATVTFLDNPACRRAVQEAYPDLVPHFDAEKEGKFKGDICRVAALYLWGGYYFDVDLKVVKPIVLSRGESFVTVLERGQQNFFQAFLAAVPGQEVLLESMRLLLEYYKGNHLVRHNKIGPSTLKDAYDAVNSEHLRGARLLQEMNLRFNSASLPGLRRQGGSGCCCNYVVHDGSEREAYFFSRVAGAGEYCKKQ